MEQLDYNLLFRWFVGLSVDDPVWVPTVFTQEPGSAARGRHRGAVLGSVLNLSQVACCRMSTSRSTAP